MHSENTIGNAWLRVFVRMEPDLLALRAVHLKVPSLVLAN
jgi:hypothetical protein